MKILVAGGAGFIGSHVCQRLLIENHEVLCVDNLLTSSESNINEFKKNKNFRFIHADVIQPLILDKKVDAIFHLASPASPNHHSPISYHALPMETMLVNTQGTLNLLKLASRDSAKFLFASSSEIYGNPLVHPQTEEYLGNTSSIGPRSIYDEAKRFGETITFHYFRQGLDVRVARIFNTYGPKMSKADMRMVVSFITQAKEGAPITVFGDGTQTRSLCYVLDTVEALMRLMFYENTKGAVINIGSQEEHTVLEYANIIKRLTGSKSEIVLSEKLPQDDPQKRRPDLTLAKKLLDWEPKTSLEDGLKTMIEEL